MVNKASSDTGGIKVIIVNKRARFDYFIEDTLEAGIVLTGPEVKSVKAGKIALQESYIRPFNDGIFLLGANITRYSHDASVNYDPLRSRKLLLHKSEIDKLRGKVAVKGYTIVPLQVYLKKGRVKIELGVAKGKNAPDKRQSIKTKEADRQIKRAMSRK